MTEAKAKALLRKIHKGGAGQQIKTMETALQQARNTHIVNNKYNEDAPVTDAPLTEATQMFNNQASDLPNLGTTPNAPVPSATWEQGKAFWDLTRPDNAPEKPMDEIY